MKKEFIYESKKEKCLKPCPFCGSTNLWTFGRSGWFTIECECGLLTPSLDEEKAVKEFWNKREEL